GSTDALLNAISWVGANARSLKIVCVNASLAYTSVSPAVDAAVNQLVQSGVVWVNAAGDARESERDTDAAGLPSSVPSPGSASKAIAAGATDELDRVTNYTSYGFPGQRKPDLVAPGGS